MTQPKKFDERKQQQKLQQKFTKSTLNKTTITTKNKHR